MAEAALSGLAGKLLGQLGSLAFKEAFERVQSIRKAKKDLDKLGHTIRIIQAVLLDAEKKQENSEAVRLWIQDVKDVLYDADDLFDDVATDALLEQLQQDKKNRLLEKVRAPFSKLSAISSNDNIAKRVKAIRKRLDDIYSNMKQYEFVTSPCGNQTSGSRKRKETVSFVLANVVIGRDDEKKAILEFLLDKSEDAEQSTISVIAIVGIGGMGKTTLAQLIYNHEEVQKNFEKRWWTCISDIVGETNVLDRIARSMDWDFHPDSDRKELISRSVVSGGKYLLVLDDVWDNDLGIWFDIMSLLSSGATTGSKIIVTTRSQSVPRAVQKDKCSVHTLKGLSENESWELFKKIAFTEEQEKDPRWTSIGREIMHKCAKVPLALKCIAAVLRGIDNIEEWESFKHKELSKINPSDESIMPTLKLSYDHLSSNLKQCFIYCSLFPQDYKFYKEELICQWIAQGYVKSIGEEPVEKAGRAYFMELFRKSFFQEAEEDEYGEIYRCKMHDLIHDLAKDVAGNESLTLTTGWRQLHKNTRHLFYLWVGWYVPENIPQGLLDENRLRTLHIEGGANKNVDQQCTKLKLLRALLLKHQSNKNVPSSIGDLKHLRYLNLSHNYFTALPESLTRLVNLITLDTSSCNCLQALPSSIGKLINLRHLYTHRCISLSDMPSGLWELTGLQRLSCLKVGEKTGCRSRLHLLAGLRLKDSLVIEFYEKINDWDEDECWQLPSTLQQLYIKYYPGRKMPHLDPIKNRLTHLSLGGSYTSTIKRLPPLRCLPYLKHLQLENFRELEYVEEEEDSENEEGTKSAPSPGLSSTLFYPCLEKIRLDYMSKLKGWSRELDKTTTPTRRSSRGIEGVEEQDPCSSFPLLSRLAIEQCQVLKSMPLCPHLRKLTVRGTIDEELMQQLMSPSSHSSTTTPPPLQTIHVNYSLIKSFSCETLTSLRILELRNCFALEKLCLAPRHLNNLEELKLGNCRELKLWEQGVHKRVVDWDSLPHLRLLVINTMGELPETLPHSLQRIQSQGQLEIICDPFHGVHCSCW